MRADWSFSLGLGGVGDCDPPFIPARNLHCDSATHQIWLEMKPCRTPPTVGHRWCCARRRGGAARGNCRERQSGPRFLHVGPCGFCASSTSNYLEDHTCKGRARREKSPPLGCRWFGSAEASPSVLFANFNVANYIIYIAVALLRQSVWGSFATDLFRHLSRALCCKITSYLEMSMKKGAPLQKAIQKMHASFWTNLVL